MFARRLSLVVVAFVVSLAWAASQAAAQPPEGEGGRGMRRGGMTFAPAGGARVLLLESVQKDLQLTADQVEKLKEVVKTTGQSMREALAGLRDLSPEDRMAKRREMREKMETQAKEARKTVEAILTPSQIERFKQIRLQVAGPGALHDPEVAKALDISKEQREKIRGLMEKVRGERGGLRNLDPEDRRQKMAELREKLQKARQGAMKAILDVLTPEQRTKLEKLEGKKIELKPSEAVLAPEEAGFDLPARGPGR